MRTTIDLPDDLHAYVRQVAHDRRESMSKVTEDLIRRGVAHRADLTIERGPRGLPIISVGREITDEDVKSLEDD